MLHRERRVAETLRSEIARIITSELADPKLGFVTVVGVKLTKDLKTARVYVSVLGDEPKRQETVAHLNKARGHIKHLLKNRIVVRYLPELNFEYDALLAQEERISELINELHRDEQPGGEHKA
jgi:ribosome-binding factor A